MPDNFSHQTNTGNTVNVAGDHTVIQISGEPKSRSELIHADVRRLFIALKERYQNRYEQKLDGRFEITLEVSENFDDQHPQKFIERYAKDAKVSEAFPAINNAFETRGRLLIVGNPGVGKTVLLLKLALNLLNKTDLAKQEAFPVIFNLASWTEKYKNLEDWLVTMLVSGYGLSKNFAITLLHQGRITFLFDGLDELARNRTEEAAHWERAKCLASINEYLRRGRKAVICCRREEFIQMRQRTGQDAPVSAKIEVLDLTKDDITLALLYAQEDRDSGASANNLLKVIETNEILLEVLSTPFYFTIALEVFDKGRWTEEDFPIRIEEIKKYLLHRFVESKLRTSPQQNSFQAEKTKVWLKWLAERLDKYGSTLFELSDLHLADLSVESTKKKSKPKWSYSNYIYLNLFFYFLFQTILGNTYGTLGFLIYLVVPTTFGILRPLNILTDEIPTEDILSLDLRKLVDRDFWLTLLRGVLTGAALGLVTAVTVRVIIFGGSSINRFFSWDVEVEHTENFVPAGIIVGALAGFFIINFENLKKVKEFASLERPYQRLWGGLSSRLFFSVSVIALFLIGMANYEFLLKNAYVYPHNEIYLILEIFPLTFLLVTLLSMPVMRHLILRVDLYRQDAMPLKYATFLDYAVSLRILERDGGYWRFRHQNLQEYFAKLDNAIEPDKDRKSQIGLIRKLRFGLEKLFTNSDVKEKAME